MHVYVSMCVCQHSIEHCFYTHALRRHRDNFSVRGWRTRKRVFDPLQTLIACMGLLLHQGLIISLHHSPVTSAQYVDHPSTCVWTRATTTTGASCNESAITDMLLFCRKLYNSACQHHRLQAEYASYLGLSTRNFGHFLSKKRFVAVYNAS